MTFNPMLAGAVTLALLGTGCATKKYVAQTVAPVEARVTTAEQTNSQQDEKLATQSGEIEQLQTDLSAANERLTSTTETADTARTAAQKAQTTADDATKLANNAMVAAEQSTQIAEQRAREVATKVDQVNNFQMASSETVLFGFNSDKLTDEAKQKLDQLAARVPSDRYMVEVQGYTDGTGNAEYNNQLSEKRADAVARYLVNEGHLALRNIDLLGSGAAAPVGDEKTSEGRKMNRRVEVRLFVPELQTAGQRASN